MNRNTLASLAIFAVGAAVGSVTTYMVVKTKYERIAQEEIDSVKDMYEKEIEKILCEETPYEEEDNLEPEPIEEVKSAEVRSYKDVVKNNGYTNYSNVEIEEKERRTEEMAKTGPYIIPPNELGEEYEIYTLVCYADGVITEYDSGEIVDDVVGAIGEGDIRDHFGEYEEDSVFVRNDARKIDYEVLRDEDNYYDE